MKYNQLEIYSQRLDAIVESAYDGILAVDQSMRLTFMNSAARHMFDYTIQESEQLKLNDLIPLAFQDKHDGYVEQFKRSQQRSKPMHTRIAVMGRRKDGSEFPLEVSISKIVVNGKMEFIGVMRDVSERSQLLEELKEAATLDHLTGLANKRLFEQELQRQIALSRRYERALSLVMLDLDHFKKVNDNYGHSSGDDVLKALAGMLKEALRESDLACRWGGEEFILLLPDTALSGAVILAEKLRKSVAALSFSHNSEPFSVTASFGVVSLHGEKETSQQLFERVDALLYEAKRSGRNCVQGK